MSAEREAMAVELLVSCMHKDGRALAEKMHISSPAVIVNQCEEDSEEQFDLPGGRITAICRNERGVGRSRNLALERAGEAVCVFSDEDIVYEPDYAEKIQAEFDRHPEADGLLFQVDVDPSRRTYRIDSFGPVGRFNCGRYPAYSMAFRRDRLIAAGVRFSLLFGGGAMRLWRWTRTSSG